MRLKFIFFKIGHYFEGIHRNQYKRLAIVQAAHLDCESMTEQGFSPKDTQARPCNLCNMR